MKHTAKCIGIAVLCLLSAVLLWSCKGGGHGADGNTTPDTTPAGAESGITSDTSAADGQALNWGEFTIIRADETDAELIQTVTDWRIRLNSALDVKMSIKTDWSKDNRQNDTIESGADVHEILIGNTNRAESRSVASENKMTFGYVVKYVNGKLVIWGTDLNATLRALEYTEAQLTAGNVLSNYDYTCDLAGEGSAVWKLATQYKIIFANGASERELTAAKRLKSALGELSGAVVGMGTDTGPRAEHEILVGNTGGDAGALSEELDYSDYVITAKDGNIIIAGGSPLATQQAVEKFIEQMSVGSIDDVNSLEYKYSFRDIRPDSVIWNMDAFVPVWKSEFTAPDWLLDFEQKAYGCVTQSGRMMSDAHRGDNYNYPENSAEGILSAVLMGVDCIEIDIRLTADNVMVLMHDETLSRTTNFSDMKGKNGLPTSDKVSDWTYEQLLQLSLRSGRGGKNSTVTGYKVCTAYEAVRIMAGRVMIHWDCKDDNIVRDTDTYLLAAELGAKESFYYYYGPDVLNKWYSLDKSDTDFKAFLDNMAAYCTRTGGSRRGRNFDYIAKYGDDETAWKKHYEDGYKMVFTNMAYELCRYIAANAQPFEIK